MHIKAPKLPFRFPSKLGELELRIHTIKANDMIDREPVLRIDADCASFHAKPMTKRSIINESVGLVIACDPASDLPHVAVTDFASDLDMLTNTMLTNFDVDPDQYHQGTPQREMLQALLRALVETEGVD